MEPIDRDRIGMLESREPYRRSAHRRDGCLHFDPPIIKILHRIADDLWIIILCLDPIVPCESGIGKIAYIEFIYYTIKWSSIDRMIEFERYRSFCIFAEVSISHHSIIGIASVSSHLGCEYILFL